MYSIISSSFGNFVHGTGGRGSSSRVLKHWCNYEGGLGEVVPLKIWQNVHVQCKKYKSKHKTFRLLLRKVEAFRANSETELIVAENHRHINMSMQKTRRNN